MFSAGVGACARDRGFWVRLLGSRDRAGRADGRRMRCARAALSAGVSVSEAPVRAANITGKTPAVKKPPGTQVPAAFLRLARARPRRVHAPSERTVARTCAAGASACGRRVVRLLTRARGSPWGAGLALMRLTQTRRAQLCPRPTCPQKRVVFVHSCTSRAGPPGVGRAAIGAQIRLCNIMRSGDAGSPSSMSGEDAAADREVRRTSASDSIRDGLARCFLHSNAHWCSGLCCSTSAADAAIGRSILASQVVRCSAITPTMTLSPTTFRTFSDRPVAI